jgi:addiction module HigA family antidote
MSESPDPAAEHLPPIPPGEILREEFMKPLGMSARQLARELSVPPNRVTAILNGERSVTAGTALLLAKRFGTTPEFWMGLQTAHDLELAEIAEDAALNRICDERAGEPAIPVTLEELRARRGKAGGA